MLILSRYNNDNNNVVITFSLCFSDRTVHSPVDTVPVDCPGKWSCTGGTFVQQSSQEPHELFHHALGVSRRV